MDGLNRVAFWTAGAAIAVLANCGGTDPCAKVSCFQPPADSCLDADRLEKFAVVGSCSNGVCSYARQEIPCPDGCVAATAVCRECDDSAACSPLYASECNAGQIRGCLLDAQGCQEWSPWDVCPVGYCADAFTCGGCECGKDDGCCLYTCSIALDNDCTGEWRMGTAIDQELGAGFGHGVAPKVAVSENGTAVAVWAYSDGGLLHIAANRYVAAAGWDGAEPIESGGTSELGGLQVAIDDQGNALAVWSRSDGTRASSWANRYVANVGWEDPFLLENSDYGIEDPVVAVNGAGDAIVAWIQRDYEPDATRGTIHADHYRAGSGWLGERVISRSDGALYNPSQPRVAINDLGDACVVWIENVALEMAWFRSGTWGAASMFTSEPGHFSFDPAVAMLTDTAMVGYWNGFSPAPNQATYSVLARLATDTSDTVLCSSDTAGALELASSEQRNIAFGVWTEAGGLSARRFGVDGGPGSGTWGAPVSLSATGSDQRISADRAGNAIAVWLADEGTTYDVWAARYTDSAASWEAAVQLASSDSFIGNADIDSAGNGFAVAVWAASGVIEARVFE
jgi:hypothetical protein